MQCGWGEHLVEDILDVVWFGEDGEDGFLRWSY